METTTLAIKIIVGLITLGVAGLSFVIGIGFGVMMLGIEKGVEDTNGHEAD